MARTPRILLVFLDGVGVGAPDPDTNPFVQAHLPRFRELLGGALPVQGSREPGEAGEAGEAGASGTARAIGGTQSGTAAPSSRVAPSTAVAPPGEEARGRLFPLDAVLGVPGLPQSGTGQIALLTGENAPAAFGRHFGPWPPVSLRPGLLARNLLVAARRAGHDVAFANALPEGWPGNLPSRRHAAPPLAAWAAGLLTRHEEALRAGEAVASEFHNDGWRRWTGRDDFPSVTPEAAGRTLVRLAREHDLTFFAHYATDHAGHRGGMAGGIAALERVDAFLGGMLDALDEAEAQAPHTRADRREGEGEGLPGGETEAASGEEDRRPLHLLLTSDHGNLEDVRGGHTRNPALGLEVAPQARRGPRRWILADVDALTGVAPAILGALGPEPIRS